MPPRLCRALQAAPAKEAAAAGAPASVVAAASTKEQQERGASLLSESVPGCFPNLSPARLPGFPKLRPESGSDFYKPSTLDKAFHDAFPVKESGPLPGNIMQHPNAQPPPEAREPGHVCCCYPGHGQNRQEGVVDVLHGHLPQTLSHRVDILGLA